MGKGSRDVAAAKQDSASCRDDNNRNFNCAAAGDDNDDGLPTIIVFDLDDCLWTPEMHELSGPPSIPVEGPLDPNDKSGSALGTVGMKVPSRRRGRGKKAAAAAAVTIGEVTTETARRWSNYTPERGWRCENWQPIQGIGK